MDYAEISKETISHLHKSYATLRHSSLDQSLRVLVELYVSQLNGCAYCCGLHLEEARKLGCSQEKLDMLPVWQEASCFSEQERLVLEWCESITFLNEPLENIRSKLFNFFNEKEIVDLTACISIMNALNRLAISLR